MCNQTALIYLKARQSDIRKTVYFYIFFTCSLFEIQDHHWLFIRLLLPDLQLLLPLVQVHVQPQQEGQWKLLVVCQRRRAPQLQLKPNPLAHLNLLVVAQLVEWVAAQ